MSPLPIGLIGYGSVAQAVHAPLLARLPGVRLSAVAEADPARLEAARRMLGAAIYADYRELLASPEVEAVVICVPTALHASVAVAALEAGKHIYLEKPLGLNMEEGRTVMASWRKAGVVGMIGFNYRFNPLYEAAHSALKVGRLGKVIGARTIFATDAKAQPEWKQTRATGGGALLDLASHHIDLVHYLWEQQVCEVSALVHSQRSEGDSATIQLRLADGCLVQSFFSLGAVEEDRFEIYGETGKLSLDRYRSTGVHITGAQQSLAWLGGARHTMNEWKGLPYRLQKLRAPWHEPSYARALSHWVAAIWGKTQAHPDLEDGLNSLMVVVAAEEAARAGRNVCVEEIF